MDFQEPAYDLYELNPIWTLKEIVFMLAGPRPLDREVAIGSPWTKWRDLVRNALIGAIKAGELIPINKEWLEESLKNFQSGKYGPGFETETYESAELKRGDAIVWMIGKRTIDTLRQQGHQVPDQAIELIEKIKRIDQIKSPDSEADNPGRSMTSFKGIFPAPEGTRWQDIQIVLTKDARLKIQVNKQEIIISPDDISKYFPQEQQKILFVKIINQSGVFDKEILKEISEKAFKNRKQIISKLRRILKKHFGIMDDPIPWNYKTKLYETQFGAHSELAPSELSDQD